MAAKHTLSITTVPEARRAGRGAGDAVRGKQGPNHLKCRHWYALMLLRGSELQFASQELVDLAELGAKVVVAGGWRMAPHELRARAGELAARLEGRPFVPFADLGDFRAPGQQVVVQA